MTHPDTAERILVALSWGLGISFAACDRDAAFVFVRHILRLETPKPVQTAVMRLPAGVLSVLGARRTPGFT